MAFDKIRNGKTGVGGFHVVTVTIGDERLQPFVLQPENGTRIHIVVKPDGALAEGAVLLPRWREWDETDPAKREMRHSRYADLFSAVRGTLHAILGYEPENGAESHGELEIMLDARETAGDALCFMRAVRRLTPADAIHLQKMIGTLVATFENSRLSKKQEAFQQFEKSLGLKDRRGRSNVGALCARVVAGRSRVNGRIDDIRSIRPRLALQLMVLEQELTLHYHACVMVEKTLRDALQSVEKIDEGAFLDSRLAARINMALEHLARRMRIFHAEPFLSLRRRLTDLTFAATIAFHEGRIETMRQNLESARALTVLMIERIELGAIHRDLSLLSSGKLPLDIHRMTEKRLRRFMRRVPELKGIEGLPYDAAVRAANDGRHALANGGSVEAKTCIAQLVEALETPLKPAGGAHQAPQAAAE